MITHNLLFKVVVRWVESCADAVLTVLSFPQQLQVHDTVLSFPQQLQERDTVLSFPQQLQDRGYRPHLPAAALGAWIPSSPSRSSCRAACCRSVFHASLQRSVTDKLSECAEQGAGLVPCRVQALFCTGNRPCSIPGTDVALCRGTGLALCRGTGLFCAWGQVLSLLLSYSGSSVTVAGSITPSYSRAT